MRNVATAASPPSAKASKAPEQRWWTPEQLRSFLELNKDESLFPLFPLAAMSGMRRGEVFGLRWEDVDLDAGVVHVRQQLVSVEHKVVVQPHPKTDHGRRSIDLDPVTVSVLRSHRKRQWEQRMAIGGGWVEAASCSPPSPARCSTPISSPTCSAGGSCARACPKPASTI